MRTTQVQTDSALDALTTLVQVIGKDRALQRWFVGLSELPAVPRRNAIYAMSHQMTERGEDPDLVAAFGLLADVRVFEAAALALRECDFFVAGA